MDLIWFASFLSTTLKEIHQESFYKWNHSKTVKYPYLTYEFEYSPENEIRDLFDVTINMFEFGTSNIKLLGLESKLVNGLDRKYLELDKAFVYIRTGRAMDIPTGSDNIQRRELRLEIKIDWKQSKEE